MQLGSAGILIIAMHEAIQIDGTRARRTHLVAQCFFFCRDFVWCNLNLVDMFLNVWAICKSYFLNIFLAYSYMAYSSCKLQRAGYNENCAQPCYPLFQHVFLKIIIHALQHPQQVLSMLSFSCGCQLALSTALKVK